jgi:multidrug resistance efflux pump
MRPGQPATISVDAYGRTYQGRVLNIAGASGARYSLLPPENATGNYVKVVQRIPVKIVFDQGAGRGAPVEDRNVRPAERTNQMTTMRVRLCRGRLTGLLVIAPASAA